MKTTGEAVHPAIRAARRRGFFMNLIDWILDIDHVDPDEAREYVASKHRGVESRPPGTLGYIRNQDGPENHGPPLTRRERRDLERRIAAREGAS